MFADCPHRLDGVQGVDDLHSPSAACKKVIGFSGVPLGSGFVAACFSRTRLANNRWETEEEQSKGSGGRANKGGRTRGGSGRGMAMNNTRQSRLDR